MRYKCICMYDGTNFHGFQSQGDLKTIQAEIERVLLLINKKPTSIHSSGRTDGGVHALGQVFHFDSDIDMGNWNMKNAINTRLDKAIYIRDVEKVSDEFHSRHDSISKEYHYLIDFSEFNPLLKNYRYYCPYKNIDINRFKEAFNVFIGSHDFRSFTKNKNKENTIRTIYSINFEDEKSLIKIKIIGNGFLHNQIRILVAMALEVGRGKISNNDLKLIMEAKNRELSPKIAPANGLYLYKVNY